MKRSIALLFLLCCTALPALADQAPWGPVTGRTNQISIERRQYGDVHGWVDLNVIIPDGAVTYGTQVDRAGAYVTTTSQVYVPSSAALPTVIRGTCDGSLDPSCSVLMAPRSATCNWNALPVSNRNALTLLLGSCQKTCFIATGTYPWGETFATENWSCAQANTAECVRMSGTLRGNRIDILDRDMGCQF